jgi:hypothetical protein
MQVHELVQQSRQFSVAFDSSRHHRLEKALVRDKQEFFHFQWQQSAINLLLPLQGMPNFVE